jgi:hypothetical protein
MSVETRIDHLIEAGRSVLDSGFDPIAFHHWRQTAHDCLTELLGADHVYTRHFETLVRRGGKRDLPAAAGILSAAQQMMVCKGLETFKGKTV